MNVLALRGEDVVRIVLKGFLVKLGEGVLRSELLSPWLDSHKMFCLGFGVTSINDSLSCSPTGRERAARNFLVPGSSKITDLVSVAVPFLLSRRTGAEAALKGGLGGSFFSTIFCSFLIAGNSPIRLSGLDTGLSRAVDSRNSKFFTDSIGKIGCPELFLSNTSITISKVSSTIGGRRSSSTWQWVWRAGFVFTSISHVFRFSSNIKSSPNKSKYPILGARED